MLQYVCKINDESKGETMDDKLKSQTIKVIMVIMDEIAYCEDLPRRVKLTEQLKEILADLLS